jgi:hypothetical protein
MILFGMDYKYHKYRRIRHWVVAPFLWVNIIPLLLLDLFLEIYHRIAFRIYLLPMVKRSDYIKIDRHKLKYLSLFDKLSCFYCGYATGVLLYAVEIVAETEKYWCGIKHKKYK